MLNKFPNKILRTLTNDRPMILLTILTLGFALALRIQINIMQILKHREQVIQSEKALVDQLPDLRQAFQESPAALAALTAPDALEKIPPSKRSLVLQGELIQGDTSYVLINSQVYTVGGKVSGHTITAIHANEVILKNNATGEEKIIRFPVQKKKTTPPVPPLQK